MNKQVVEYDIDEIQQTLRDTEEELEELESVIIDLWKKGTESDIRGDLRRVTGGLCILRHTIRRTRKGILRRILEINEAKTRNVSTRSGFF